MGRGWLFIMVKELSLFRKKNVTFLARVFEGEGVHRVMLRFIPGK